MNINRYIFFIILSVALLSFNVHAQQPTAKTFNDIGLQNLENTEYSEAVDAFKHAVSLKPDYAEAHYNLGNAYYGLHRYEEALDSFRKAVKVNPRYSEAYFSLGLVSSMLGMEEEAIDALNNAVKYDPKSAKAYMALGDMYSEIKRFNDAIEAYRNAIKINPKFAEARYKLAISYLDSSSKDVDAAKKEYELLEKLDEDFAKDLQERLKGKK